MPKKLPTIDIKGKEYVMVKDRIIAFNEQYPTGSIRTEILTNDDKHVVVKATIDTGEKEHPRWFTGHSEAIRGAGQMGNVPVEVAETSAVGRALAMLGIGIIESVASADEVKKSTTSYPKRELSVKQKNMLKVKIHKTGKPMPDEDWFDSLDYKTFNSALAKLKDLPEIVSSWPSNIDRGDDKTEIEGTREDYDPNTGQML